jgi:hypothetical protein
LVQVIGRTITDVKKDLTKGVTQEEFDTFENYFNEENWIIFKRNLKK